MLFFPFNAEVNFWPDFDPSVSSHEFLSVIVGLHSTRSDEIRKRRKIKFKIQP